MMSAPPGQVVFSTARRLPSLPLALFTLRYAYPALVFSYYIISSTIAVCTLNTESPRNQTLRRTSIQLILLFSVFTYFVQLSSLLIQSLIARAFIFPQDTIIGLLSCVLVFGLQLARLFDSENPVWYPYVGSYLIALVFEPVIEVLSILQQSHQPLTSVQYLEISTATARYASFLLVLLLFFGLSRGAGEEASKDAERQPLIPKDGNPETSGAGPESEGQQSGGYGAVTDGSKDTSQSEDASQSEDTPQSTTAGTAESSWERRERRANEQMEKRLKEKGNWISYAKSFLIFVPYIWPVNNKGLQIRAGLVGVCLLAMNFVNVLIPRQLGIVMDALNKVNGKNPWVEVLIFVALKLVASDAGISLLRQWLWIPVEYYSFDALSTAAYSHVLNLSSDFHDTKSTSDTMMAIQSGQSVSNMLESICFRAIPMLIDMGVAFVYLSVTFGPYEGLITIATATIFLYIATKLIAGLRSARRSEVGAWFEEHYVRQAGIQGWTTVACFNQIDHEERRYSAAVKDRVAKSQTVYVKYIVSYAFQYLVLLSGLMAGLFLAVFQVTTGQATPGQFIMLLTYWSQLVSPLSFFAGLGKNISRDLIQAEQLLEIMQTKPSVTNKEGAPPLQLNGGNVLFNHVHFSYDKKKTILKDVSFAVGPGMTVAIVGTTGAGKSTILKLLDRFYDVTGGSIEIDGQDIRDVDLYSLRAQVGVVPQAPVLFDDTIMNNIRYAKLTATDEEVFEACKAASIHDQILAFTDGYNTRVGERGIKLSGGELQRVAIARAILKHPAIVLLDEATSAVDTETEQKIQVALSTLCNGRTTFIVAHRLSTIMNADRIIVVADGQVIEQGSHEELIGAGGKYADLWSQQVFIRPKMVKAGDGSDDSTSETPTIAGDFVVETTGSEDVQVSSEPLLLDDDSQHSDSEEGEEGEAAAEVATAAPATPVKGSVCHKKEGSRLNPDAPAFTPRSVAAPPSPGSPMRYATCGDAAFDVEETNLVGHSPRRQIQYIAAPVIFVPAAYPVAVHPQTREGGLRPVTGVDETKRPTSTDQAAAKVSDETGAGCTGVGLRHPRYSRRIQSKSEPFLNSSDNDS